MAVKSSKKCTFISLFLIILSKKVERYAQPNVIYIFLLLQAEL